MDPILTALVAALIAGATAKAKEVASQAVGDAYEGLKTLVIRKLGKSGAVQSVEDEPESESARSTLIEALARKDGELQTDPELRQLIHRLELALANLQATTPEQTADIDIETVRGRVNATVENLVASGRIKLGSIVAETGDAKVSGVTAGIVGAHKEEGPKNG